MNKEKKVVVFTTGGTIAMKFDPAVNGLVPAVSGADLAAAVPGLDAVAEVEVREFWNKASCNMTPESMFRLSGMIEEALKADNVAGAVVTHGTDTVEETAFMLDLLHKSDKPVVLTAAMRGASDTSPDGPMNICCAVKTAASDEARGKGVLVVLNEVIHAAAQVRKTHSANPATFESPWWGPLGYCDVDKVVIRREPTVRRTFAPKAITARVDIVTAQTGVGREYIDFAVSQGCAGIVIEGFGRGNIPPAMEAGIKDASDKGVAVVISTRTPGGRPYQVYAYPGSVTDSRNNGAVKGTELSSAKTRLKLIVMLSENPALAQDKAELERLLDL
jgi:L-asparaginase